MTGTWFDGRLGRDALSELEAQYPGERIEIVRPFDIAYVAWECDYQGALITRDGRPELVILQRIASEIPVVMVLRDRLAEYRRLVHQTEAVLAQFLELGGVEGDALLEAQGAQHLRERARQRRPGESDDEYGARMRLWRLSDGTD